MKLKMFGLAAAAAVSLSLLTGCPAEEKKETTTTTTTTETTTQSPAAAASAETTTTTTTTETHGSPAAAASATAASAAPVATQQASADGAAIYTKNNCAACHGAKGEGAVGPNLQQVEAKGDELIRTTIMNGRNAMPAFKDQIKGADLDALVAYVKSL